VACAPKFDVRNVPFDLWQTTVENVCDSIPPYHLSADQGATADHCEVEFLDAR